MDSYHLLISDGGDKCICIFVAPKNTKFTDGQKEKLTELYGEYIVVPIHYLSLNCYPRLDVINNINEYLEL